MSPLPFFSFVDVRTLYKAPIIDTAIYLTLVTDDKENETLVHPIKSMFPTLAAICLSGVP